MTNRSCLIFVLDQSQSMSRPAAADPSRSMAQLAADWLNDFLTADLPKQLEEEDVVDIAVLGHATDAFGAPELAFESGVEGLAGAEGFCVLREIQERFGERPLKPRATRGTATVRAISQAGKFAAAWTAEHGENGSPVVIVIGDGESRDGSLDQCRLPGESLALILCLAAQGDSSPGDFLPQPPDFDPELHATEQAHPTAAHWKAVASVLPEDRTGLKQQLRDYGVDIDFEDPVGFIGAPTTDELEATKWVIVSLLFGA